MAEYERGGAELERRWAELVEHDPARGTTSAPRDAERVTRRTRLSADRLSGVLTHIADALERTACLADEHAERCERAKKSRAAADEREAARRAREAAQRARSQAEEWLKLGGT